jgi:hypothetical protein
MAARSWSLGGLCRSDPAAAARMHHTAARCLPSGLVSEYRLLDNSKMLSACQSSRCRECPQPACSPAGKAATQSTVESTGATCHVMFHIVGFYTQQATCSALNFCMAAHLERVADVAHIGEHKGLRLDDVQLVLKCHHGPNCIWSCCSNISVVERFLQQSSLYVIYMSGRASLLQCTQCIHRQ